MSFPGQSINELVFEEPTENDDEETNGNEDNNENEESDDDETVDTNSTKNNGLYTNIRFVIKKYY